jgi:hypothetical protein
MTHETTEVINAKRRTVLKAIGVGAAGIVFIPSRTAAQSPSRGEIILEDNFEDGQLDWTDANHPEFWTETNGRVHYNPSTSAGDTGDNFLYANETFDGDQGLLEWPVAIEFKAYASDTSAGLGVLATSGGPTDSGRERGTPRLAIQDGKYNNQFSVANSEGKSFTLTGGRDNNTWYTYRLIPDLESNEIRVERNNESWTVPEPNDDPIGNTSIVLSGGTCWGCGGNGDRKYEYITVWDIPTRIEVDIDIRPGGDPNAINPDDRGTTPVAVLHTDEFDSVERVNVDSLRFGDPEDIDNDGGATPAHDGHVEDVDGDGDDDLVLHFPTQDMGFEGNEDTGKLVGETNDGTPLFGADDVLLVS